jgi:hypothetical protein
VSGGLDRGEGVRPSASQTCEPNAGGGYGSHRLGAVPQSVLHGGSSQSHDLLRAFRTAYRSDTHVRPATFGTLRSGTDPPFYVLFLRTLFVDECVWPKAK